MSWRRPVRGLVNLLMKEDLKSNESAFVPLPELEIYSTKVQEKIRAEEERISNAEANGRGTGDRTDFPEKKQKSSKVPGRKRKRRRVSIDAESVTEILDSDEELYKPPKSRARRAPSKRNNSANELPTTFQDLSSKENEEVFVLSEDDEGAPVYVYRIIVKQSSTADGIWVRLTKTDTMEKVYKEVSKVVSGHLDLMMDGDNGRREVLPTDTPEELNLESGRCYIFHLYVTNEDSIIDEDCVVLRFITTNRRQAKEVSCKPDESFKDIAERYCQLVNISLDSIRELRFDGEILPMECSPADEQMESGVQIEVIL